MHRSRLGIANNNDPDGDNNDNDNINITGDIQLDIKDGELASGQFVTFYRLDSEECLGSGVISERHWAKYLSQKQTQQVIITQYIINMFDYFTQ